MKINLLQKALALFCIVGMFFSLVGCTGTKEANTSENEAEKAADSTAEIAAADTYSLVQNVYSWGSCYSKIILPADFTDGTDYVDASAYEVKVKRYDIRGEALGEGGRVVTAAYRSDEKGKNNDSGSYVTLDLAVTANLGIAQPYYTSKETNLKEWAKCEYTVTYNGSDHNWSKLETVYHPDEETFKTDTKTFGDVTYPYAYYEAEDDGAKHPLVVWLHGQGSGGSDIGFVTGGMLVTNFVSKEVQDIFGGAYILLPQSKTMWKDAGGGSYTTDGSSMYTESLMELINSFVEEHPNIDPSRIYVGGCSNGGFETIALLLHSPDTFAAAFPVCQAFNPEWVDDEELSALSKTPLWFVHCTTDPVVNYSYSEDLYKRLVEGGAENVHLTTYESISDPDYGNAYIGHFAWVYSLKNMCRTDYDGSPVKVDGKEVSLYEWVAAQKKD